jgi:hypothetical protein
VRDVLLRDDDVFDGTLIVVDDLVGNDRVDERAVFAQPRRFKCRNAGSERFTPELIEALLRLQDDQRIDGASDRLRCRIAEKKLGAAVPVNDFAGWRGDGDRVRSLPEEKIGQLARQESSSPVARLFP